MAQREHPPALPHGELEEIFDDVFFVMGSVRMPGPLPVRFSRNMVVVREGEALTLIHSLRLDDAGLAALDGLGEVRHVIRVAGFHGMDDPFYKERYGATVWAVDGAVYSSGFEIDESKAYFQADAYVKEGDELPIGDASLFCFEGQVAEALVKLDREGGVLVTGDSLQNWASTDAYFSLLGKAMMRVMGFLKPCNVGPGWLRGARPTPASVERLKELEFEHVLPAHGIPVIGDAKAKFTPAIEAALRRLS